MKTLKQRILTEMTTKLKKEDIAIVNTIWHDIIRDKDALRFPYSKMEVCDLRDWVENRYIQLKPAARQKVK